jgi:hypothetical protein
MWEATVKYLILIHSNPKSRALWETFDEEQQMALGVGHMRLTAELAAAGELIASEGLTGPTESTWVSVRDGETVTSDGPYAEVKEHLAGFYLIECDSLERAVAWAAKAPDAATGAVEVRPVLDMSAWDFDL